MKTSKNILSVLCLLALLTSFAVFGVDHIYRASQATETGDCTMCVDCDKDKHGVPMACCMGTKLCDAPGDGTYSCDGILFNCYGDIIDEHG